MDYVHEELYYCSLCDRYFPEIQSRADHVQYSTNHPKCDKCDLRFANYNALRNHFTVSQRHYYCSSCRLHFETAAGFHAHVQYASIHRGNPDDDDDSDDDDIDDSYEGWEDDIGRIHFPEETTHEEPSVTDDDHIDPRDEYWDEDDEVPTREDLSWAPVPSATVANQQQANSASLPTPVSPVERPMNDTAREEQTASDATAATSKGWAVGCPLCLEAVVQPHVTRCGHIFCGSCIVDALNIQRRCPVCRVRAGHKQLRRIFFSTPIIVAN